jgi:hypothetical protein
MVHFRFVSLNDRVVGSSSPPISSGVPLFIIKGQEQVGKDLLAVDFSWNGWNQVVLGQVQVDELVFEKNLICVGMAPVGNSRARPEFPSPALHHQSTSIDAVRKFTRQAVADPKRSNGNCKADHRNVSLEVSLRSITSRPPNESPPSPLAQRPWTLLPYETNSGEPCLPR